MFYQLLQPKKLDGTSQYLDITEHLHRFLNTASLSADITFRTADPDYPPLLALYYKESLLPDFSISLYKGRGALTVKRGGSQKLLVGGEAVCDNMPHTISFRGSQDSVKLWMDGVLIIEDNTPGPWCQFGYVGFATIGRGTRADQYCFFKGDILSVRLSQKELPLPSWQKTDFPQRRTIFSKGTENVENYRIPSLLTVGDVTIASADARLEAPGDNPNHICRAIRLSTDSGETWSGTKLFCDYGGTGRDDGAAAIDGSLLHDKDTQTVFMLFSHTSRGIGAHYVSSEDAFDAQGRKRLWDADNHQYYVEQDGRVFHDNGEPTAYTVGNYGELYQNGEPVGSICHGEARILRQADVSFLQLIQSHDSGRTWSDPVDLNPQVKAEWMRFVGAGPGTGIQIQEGPCKGRLLFPVYYTNQHMIASSGAIYSDDHGKTWHMGASANDGRLFDGTALDAQTATDPRSNLGECQVTELPGGRLKIYLRNGYGPHTLSAYSDDGGESWHHFHETNLPDPQCQSHVLKVKHNGQAIWLFSNPANSTARVQGVVRVSFDGGETWPVSRLVEPGEFAYSCMTQLPDGQIGLIYEGRDVSLRFMKFPLEWLLDGSI